MAVTVLGRPACAASVSEETVSMPTFAGETAVLPTWGEVAGGCAAPSSALLAADSNQAEQWLSNASATAQTEIVVRALRGGHKGGVTKRLSHKVLVGRARSKLRLLFDAVVGCSCRGYGDIGSVNGNAAMRPADCSGHRLLVSARGRCDR
jgi:hypothetical protein